MGSNPGIKNVYIKRPAGPLANVVNDPAKQILICTARQIGKTYQMLLWLIVKALSCQDPIWENWYCAPTYKWAKRVAWRILKRLVPPELIMGVPNNSELYIQLVNGAVISIKGMDSFDDMVGNPLWSCVLDEFGSMKPGVLDYLAASFAVPSQNGGGFIAVVGTPRPYGNPDFSELYHNTIKGVRNDFKAYPVFKTADSPFVSQEFLARQKEILTPQMFRQEFEGSWECFEGQMFQRDDLDKACRPWSGYITQKVRVWDLATTKHDYSDFTAGGLYGRVNDEMIFMDLVHGKWEYPDAKKIIIQTAKTDGQEIPIVIEGVGGFLAVVQDIKSILAPMGYNVTVEKRSNGLDKLALSSPIQAKISNGKFIFLPFDKRSAALDEWGSLSFDQKTWLHDDILDTAGIAHSRLFNFVTSETMPILMGRRDNWTNLR